MADKHDRRDRMQIDLGENLRTVLDQISDAEAANAADLVRKAIKLLGDLHEEKVFLTTPEGSRIPKSVIFY